MQIEKYAGDYCEDIIVEKRDALHNQEVPAFAQQNPHNPKTPQDQTR